VGAAVGKYHTLLVGANGKVYGSGGNLCGQLGINNMGLKGIDKFRKCVVVGQLSGKSDEENNVDEDAEEEDGVKIVQVSWFV
jgi:alpha-tubulin suppressor-like RCC1 family protein